MDSVTQTINSSPGATGTWTDAISPTYRNKPGYLNIGISGTWVATVTLQRSFDAGQTWHDVEEWTSNIQMSLIDPVKGMRYRIGVDNGDYSSGSVVVILSR